MNASYIRKFTFEIRAFDLVILQQHLHKLIGRPVGEDILTLWSAISWTLTG